MFRIYSEGSHTLQLATRMPVGSIESYNSEREEWSSYTERFDQYALANGIEEEKKIVAVFLTVVGPETYSLLRDLLTPARPSDLKYKELVDIPKSSHTLREIFDHFGTRNSLKYKVKNHAIFS